MEVGTNSTIQHFTISGNNLTSDIIIAAPAGYQISLNGSAGYTSSVIMTPTGGTVAGTTVYVRFTPVASISYTGNISVSSAGATPKTIGLSGAGINPSGGFITGLASYYKFDGDLTDCVGGIHGTNSNTSDIVLGKINHARGFSGNSSCYVETNSTTGFNYLHNGSDFTSSVWEKHNSDMSLTSTDHILGNSIGGDRNGVFLSVFQDDVNFVVGKSLPCYEAEQTLTVAGVEPSVTVESNSEVHLVSGQNIDLLPGFKALSGGTLHAYISTDGNFCNNPKLTEATMTNEAEQPSDSMTPGVNQFFRLYPNPTTARFTLELSKEPSESPVLVRVYNMMGAEIMNKQMDGVRKSEFSLESQLPGIYLVIVMLDGRMEMVKIVRQ